MVWDIVIRLVWICLVGFNPGTGVDGRDMLRTLKRDKACVEVQTSMGEWAKQFKQF